MISGVASPKIWEGKMFDFRRITLFCLEKRLSKHKMTIFSKNLGGMAPLPPRLATPMSMIFISGFCISIHAPKGCTTWNLLFSQIMTSLKTRDDDNFEYFESFCNNDFAPNRKTMFIAKAFKVSQFFNSSWLNMRRMADVKKRRHELMTLPIRFPEILSMWPLWFEIAATRTYHHVGRFF